MRTPQTNDSTDPMDDCDDIFGPPRTYPTSYPPRNRPSMISAKYKQKEERRKVLKISFNKLKKIDDPEANLCRSVLINNTMKRLQQETRDEKLQKQQLSYPRCYNNDSYLNIKTEFLKNEKTVEEVTSSFTSNERIENIVLENDFHARLEEEINHVSSTGNTSLNELVNSDYEHSVSSSVVKEDSNASRKRPFDELVDDCDMHDVLSQFYMPPTPRMLTAMDEDEDVNVVDDDPLVKRLKLEEDHHHQPAPSNEESLLSQHTSYTDYTNSVTSFMNNNMPSSRYSNNCVIESESSSYSCGQASMFGEMQNNVYHSLITSLET